MEQERERRMQTERGHQMEPEHQMQMGQVLVQMVMSPPN
jgi:hypothetical protein